MIAIENSPLQYRIITVDETASTNDLAKEYARQGASEGLVITAKRQTQGRGRRGREWYSQTGGLYFSILLRPNLPFTEMAKTTLLAGVAAVETLRQHYRAAAELKWPNDVIIAGRKIAGILTEGSINPGGSNYIIVGIGVNTNPPAEPLPESIRVRAGFLSDFTNLTIENQVLLRQFLNHFNQHYVRFAQGKHHEFLKLVRCYTRMLGQEIIITEEKATFHAKAVDIDETGALIVKKSDGTIRTLLAADVSIRSQSI